MRFSCLLLLNILGFLSCGAPREYDAQRSAAVLELSEQRRLFWELTPGRLRLYGGGWVLADWPLDAALLSYCRPPSLTRVAEIVPFEPPRQMVVDAATLAEAAADTTGAVSGPEQVVSVEDMPAAFAVRWDDGTWWLVNAGGWPGWSAWFRQWDCGLRILRELSARCWSGSAARLVLVEMDETASRRLFWSLREGLACAQ
ncbi:MAG: hypothetical protein Kow00109_16100 [Acidobacteriota bacterium]